MAYIDVIDWVSEQLWDVPRPNVYPKGPYYVIYVGKFIGCIVDV